MGADGQESGRGTLGEENPTNRPGLECPVEPDVVLSLLAAARDCLQRVGHPTAIQVLALKDVLRAERLLSIEADQGSSAAAASAPSAAEPALLRCSSSRE